MARRSGSSWRSTGSIVKFVESASAVRGKSPRPTGVFLRLINPFKARSRADEARFHNREARRFRRRRLCSPRSSRQLLRLKAPPNQHAPPQQHLYHVRGPQQLLMKYAHIVRPIVAHASEHSALSYLHTPAPARVVIRTLPETRTYTGVLRPSSALKKSVRRLPPYVTPLSTLFVQGFQSQPRS